MAQHLRALAILLIILGLGGGLISLVWLIASGGPGGLLLSFDGASAVLAPVLVGMVLMNILFAAPLAFAGMGLLRAQGWARTLATVLCALEVINFPFGSVLGAYGLWVLTSLEVEPLFEERAQQR
ncbi:MAG: hypothetical protein NW208_14085 [Bryobacter sp.]|nr:hypothetical protein [Bryobacter sp.]